MPSEKDRLYVALYARGGAPTMPGLEDTYHWAIIVGPKSESSTSRGSRFHAKEKLRFVGNPPVAQSVWQYEELDIPMVPTSMLLVRIMVGKVKNMNRLRSIFQRTPVRPDIEGWNCVGWVKEALLTAMQDGRALGTSAGGWQEVRDTAMFYVESKKEVHRFDGTIYYDPAQVATWDMLEGTELMP
ncbi:hypothetical protein CORC01_14091 [Colletotrichum orchidophilum]|uniref:Uncharacterized protein n=1 Tax=Colletotrichum orchidophilum TaxID=1209926 RepID=A0A1G4AN63_9PEZI|nr:uncharacterized protein CORC01_14091 [Colletotrichum orchidophilum]OHE90607.1 hypothetical protein CORC01_14091 [Colletotrichum orchidophilum]